MTPVAAIRGLVPGAEAAVYEDLRAAADSGEAHFQVWRKEELPERLRFREHRRIQPIIVLAEEGWSISKSVTVMSCPRHVMSPDLTSVFLCVMCLSSCAGVWRMTLLG